MSDHVRGTQSYIAPNVVFQYGNSFMKVLQNKAMNQGAFNALVETQSGQARAKCRRLCYGPQMLSGDTLSLWVCGSQESVYTFQKYFI